MSIRQWFKKAAKSASKSGPRGWMRSYKKKWEEKRAKKRERRQELQLEREIDAAMQRKPIIDRLPDPPLIPPVTDTEDEWFTPLKPKPPGNA